MHRKTKQYEAIRQVFRDEQSPLSPDDVLIKAHRLAPGIGQATVYRWLKNLIETGWLIEVNGPESLSLYERSGKAHHHHFFCRSCGSMFEVDGCPVSKNVNVPKGFKVEDHELTLYGRCPACS